MVIVVRGVPVPVVPVVEVIVMPDGAVSTPVAVDMVALERVVRPVVPGCWSSVPRPPITKRLDEPASFGAGRR